MEMPAASKKPLIMTEDMDSTVEVPSASKEDLSMVDDDDEDEDKTLMVPNLQVLPSSQKMKMKLDLAKAYIELGDNENAKTILEHSARK